MMTNTYEKTPDFQTFQPETEKGYYLPAFPAFPVIPAIVVTLKKGAGIIANSESCIIN